MVLLHLLAGMGFDQFAPEAVGIGDPDFVLVERFSFYLAMAIFGVLGFVAAWKIPARLGLLLHRAWSFYRTGQCGVDGIISGFVTGDTLGRLRIARQFFRLESRVTFASPRPWVVHCPMCQTILIGYPTDRARCPNCSQGITYLQLAMNFDADVPNKRFAGEPAFGWVPGRVGEYLKKRYGSIWR